jgi:cytochrome P450
MLQLITAPRCYEKLQSEIDSAVKSGLVSSPITDIEGKKLPYLQACIKEGIRLWPPISGIMPKVSKSDDVIHGVHIPAGTEVGWCAWRIFRNKDVFGADAEMFNPERWFEKDEDKLKEMENTADLAFSPGRWKCLGQSIAFIELNKVFVEVDLSPLR